MPRRDSQNESEADAARRIGGTDSLQKPEVPEISVFDSFSDDGEEWQQDGDPTQELDDNDILEEHDFVLVGDDGQPIPDPDEELAPGTNVEPDLPPVPRARAARLPRPTGKAPLMAAAEQEPSPPESKKTKAKAKGKAKTKGEGKAKAKTKGEGKAKAKTKGEGKAKAKTKGEGKPKPKTKAKPKNKAKPTTKPKTRAKAAPKAGAAEADSQDHFVLGMALRKENRPQRAIEELTKALRQGSRGVPCHTTIGLCYRDLGNASKSISSFKNALFQEDVTADETTELHYELGCAHEREEEWEEALYYYRRVVRADPSFLDTAIRIEQIKRFVAKQRG